MSINGHCPHCNADMDGELVYDSFIDAGYDCDIADKWAKQVSGYEKHGLLNKWSRCLSIYDITSDRTINYECPDCSKQWNR